MAHFPEKTLEMSDKEMGEIALVLVRAKLRDGMRFTPHLRRKAGEKVKELGLKLDRTMIFAEILTRELMEETFKK